MASFEPFRGTPVGAVPLAGPPVDLAWDAIIRQAATKQKNRKATPDRRAVILYPHDLLRRLRFRNPGRLLFLVTDASGSMGSVFTGLAKRIALTLLERVYLRREQVAMLAFRDQSAELVFPPTRQSELVQRAMADLPCGGTTPLSRGLELALTTLERTLPRAPEMEATVLVISDGKANVSAVSGHQQMLAELEKLARRLSAMDRCKVVFLDTTEEGKNDYPARWLSEHLKARRVVLHALKDRRVDPVVEIVRALSGIV